MFGKKKVQVDFYSVIPEVAMLEPIVNASDVKPKWWSNAQRDFVAKTKEPNFGKEKFRHTYKCSGISNLLKHGWILKTWQDIIIKTDGDGKAFQWSSTINRGGDPVGFHEDTAMANFYEQWGDNLKYIVKIQTPWRCVVPKGYYLYEKSVPYNDNPHFTTQEGFFSQEYGVAELNPQLKWHTLNDTIVIPSGTPIAHYMLIPKTQYSMTAQVATEEQERLAYASSIETNKNLVSNRGASKCVFARLFK